MATQMVQASEQERVRVHKPYYYALKPGDFVQLLIDPHYATARLDSFVLGDDRCVRKEHGAVGDFTLYPSVRYYTYQNVPKNDFLQPGEEWIFRVDAMNIFKTPDSPDERYSVEVLVSPVEVICTWQGECVFDEESGAQGYFLSEKNGFATISVFAYEVTQEFVYWQVPITGNVVARAPAFYIQTQTKYLLVHLGRAELVAKDVAQKDLFPNEPIPVAPPLVATTDDVVSADRRDAFLQSQYEFM